MRPAPSTWKTETYPMNRLYSLLIVATLAFACASANAVDPPKHKPGLWEMNIQTGDVKAVSHMCIDSTSEAKSNATVSAYMKASCSKYETRMEGSKWITDSECTFAGQHVTDHTVTNSIGDNAYRTDGTKTNVDAKWLGACQPGQVPGKAMWQR
jgi:hypothetical protein